MREAIDCFQKALDFNPEFYWSNISFGKLLLQKNQLEQATIYISKAIIINPLLAFPYYYLAETLYRKKDYELAVEQYQKAVDIFPSNSEFYFSLGNTLFQLRQLEQAILNYKKAIQLKQTVSIYHHMLGDALNRNRQFKEAEFAYRTAIEIEPNFPRSYRNLAHVLKKQDRLDEVITSYRAAIKIQPTFFQCCYELADALQKQGKLEEAVIYYRRAVELRPNSAEYLCSLGCCEGKLGEYKDGITYLLKALKIRPDYHQCYHNLADILKEQGYSDEATNCSNFTLPVPLLKSLNLWTDCGGFALKSSINFDRENINRIKIHPQSQVSLLPPGTLDNIIHNSFQKNAFNHPETFIVKAKQATIRLGDTGTSWAITASEDCVVPDISRGNLELLMSSDIPFRSVSIDNRVVTLLTRHPSNNYFHWMVDALPQLELLRLGGVDLSSVDKFILGKYSSSFQKETLRYLGISNEKILPASQPPYKIKAKEIIVPQPTWIIPSPDILRVPKFACDFLRKTFIKKNFTKSLSKYQRIYIKRSGYRRVITNENQVIEFLSNYGFNSVSMESMTVGQQASLLASAEVVVAPHGAGLTNLVFCSPGTKVIEIFSPVCVRNCYWVLSNSCGLEYYYLLGSNFDNTPIPEKPPQSPVDRHLLSIKNILVNIGSLCSLLKIAGL